MMALSVDDSHEHALIVQVSYIFIIFFPQTRTRCTVSWYGNSADTIRYRLVQAVASPCENGENTFLGRSLEKVWMNDNQLHGEIPSLEGMEFLKVRTRDGLETRTKLKQCLILQNFGSFVFLGAEFLVISVQELSLARNNLEGAIPKTLGELRSISYLYLAGNKLNGTIPPERGPGWESESR